MDNKKFSQKLVSLRKEKGLTQSDIAEKLHVSPQAVSKWENGDSMPDIDLLLPLAELLDVSVDELLGREKEKVVFAEPQEGPIDLSNLFLRIQITTTDDDHAKVNVNLPLQLLEVIMDKNGHLNIDLGNNPQVKNIDFRKLIALVEKGVLGNLVDIQADDATIKIFAERIS